MTVAIETLAVINGWVRVSDESYARKVEEGVFEVWNLHDTDRFIYTEYFNKVSISDVCEEQFNERQGTIEVYNSLITDEERAVYIGQNTLLIGKGYCLYGTEQVVEMLQANEVLAVPEGKTADYAITERMNKFLIKMANDWQDAMDQAQIAGYVLCNQRSIDFVNLVNHTVEEEAFSARAKSLEKFIRELNEKLGYKNKKESYELVEEILKRVK